MPTGVMRHRKRLLGRQLWDAAQLCEDEMEPVGAVARVD
jgi:hypothetical protein